MPAIADRDGPSGRAISIFESGAILQYLGRKTAKFYPQDERGRIAVDRAIHIRVEEASKIDMSDPKVRAVLFTQRAR